MSASDARKRLEKIIENGEDTQPEQETAYFATECPNNENAEYVSLLRQCQFGLFGLYAEDGQDFAGSSDDIHVEIAKLSVVTGMGKRRLKMQCVPTCGFKSYRCCGTFKEGHSASICPA